MDAFRNCSEQLQSKAHGAQEPECIGNTRGFRAPRNAAFELRSKLNEAAR